MERRALRLAFGVAACFAAVETLGSNATFLAPLLAAQMLIKLDQPPSMRQGLGLIVLIAGSTGLVLAVTSAFIRYPTVLIITLALLNYLAFYAHRRGAPESATLLLQISAAALPVVAVLSPEGATNFATTLLSGGFVALLTAWMAHAAFPTPAPTNIDKAPALPTRRASRTDAARLGLLDTFVLLPPLAWLILDASEFAVVVLIVILTLLRLPDANQGPRVALGLIFGNLIGGLVAVVVYNLVLLNDTLAFFFAISFAVSLMFASRIARLDRLAPIYAVSFATFILLLGLGLTPLPTGSGEAFVSRLFNVLLATAYAIGAMSLAEPWRPRPSHADVSLGA